MEIKVRHAALIYFLLCPRMKKKIHRHLGLSLFHSGPPPAGSPPLPLGGPWSRSLLPPRLLRSLWNFFPPSLPFLLLDSVSVSCWESALEAAFCAPKAALAPSGLALPITFVGIDIHYPSLSYSCVFISIQNFNAICNFVSFVESYVSNRLYQFVCYISISTCCTYLFLTCYTMCSE